MAVDGRVPPKQRHRLATAQGPASSLSLLSPDPNEILPSAASQTCLTRPVKELVKLADNRATITRLVDPHTTRAQNV